jgi:hypothetical protein
LRGDGIDPACRLRPAPRDGDGAVVDREMDAAKRAGAARSGNDQARDPVIAAAASISGWRALPGQPRLVGQDDELDPVPRTELGEQVVDVRLDRCLGHHEFGGDLRVGQALG